MQSIIHSTRKKFIATIVLSIALVVLITWIILQTFNVVHTGKDSSVQEVHNLSTGNAALTEYIQDQEAYSAHFVSLVDSIKAEERKNLTTAFAIISVAVTLLGVLIAVFVSKILMRPVQEAYDSQERFLQDAAHELRNPLATMTVALQRYKKDVPDTKLLETFRRQTKRLVNITEDLLFLESKKAQQVADIELSTLLLDIIEEYQTVKLARSITVDVRTDAEIVKSMAPQDYIRIIKNLIDNALKYSPDKSTITVTQKILKSSIVITVKDQGVGIPKKDLAYIGQRFFRASNVGNVDGTGLGIAIVTKILNIYGGKIEYKSTPNKGTTAVVTIPA